MQSVGTCFARACQLPNREDIPSPTSVLSPMRLFALATPFFFLSGILADSAGLYPPGLLPIINRANGLLSAGQFNDAARAYSDAIGVFYSPGTIFHEFNCPAQSNLPPITFFTTNGRPRTSRSVGTVMLSTISIGCSLLQATRSTMLCS